MTFLAYLLTIVAIGWSILWSIAFVGLWDSTQKCKYDAQTNQQVCSVNYGILFVLFISYFFTHQVLQVRIVMNTANRRVKKRTAAYFAYLSVHLLRIVSIPPLLVLLERGGSLPKMPRAAALRV